MRRGIGRRRRFWASRDDSSRGKDEDDAAQPSGGLDLDGGDSSDAGVLGVVAAMAGERTGERQGEEQVGRSGEREVGRARDGPLVHAGAGIEWGQGGMAGRAAQCQGAQ